MKNYPFFKIETRKYPKQYSKEGTIGILEERWERILDDDGNLQYHYTYRPDGGQLFFTVQWNLITFLILLMSVILFAIIRFLNEFIGYKNMKKL